MIFNIEWIKSHKEHFVIPREDGQPWIATYLGKYYFFQKENKRIVGEEIFPNDEEKILIDENIIKICRQIVVEDRLINFPCVLRKKFPVGNDKLSSTGMNLNGAAIGNISNDEIIENCMIGPEGLSKDIIEGVTENV